LFAMMDSVSRYFERAVGTLPHLSRTFRLIWRAAPKWTLAWIFLLLIQGFLPVATVYLTRPVVNGIVAAVRSGGEWRPILVPAVLASTLPTLAVVLRHAVQHHDFRIRTTPVERRTWYYDWLLTTGETAPEIRLFDLGGHFREAYQNLRDRLRIERVDLARRQGMAQFLAGVSAWAVTGAALIWMVSRALRGFISLGDLALFYQAFQQGLNL